MNYDDDLECNETPPVILENIGVGCDLVEHAFKTVGPSGTWEEFHEAIGGVVSSDTSRSESVSGALIWVCAAALSGPLIGMVAGAVGASLLWLTWGVS